MGWNRDRCCYAGGAEGDSGNRPSTQTATRTRVPLDPAGVLADEPEDGLPARHSDQPTARGAAQEGQQGRHGADSVLRRGAGSIIDVNAEGAAAALHFSCDTLDDWVHIVDLAKCIAESRIRLMKFKYPKDAVEALFRSSSPNVLEALFPIKVPRHLVYEMADIAYHASFLTEEGRPTRFQLALLSRDRVSTSPDDPSDEMTILGFEEPRPLSIQEILRLAPATDFTTTLICVDAMMHIPGVANRGLEIWGVVSPGTSARRLIRLQAESAVHVPKCLIVSSFSPGHVQLALNIRPLVVLRSGKVAVLPRHPRGLPGPVMRLLRSGSSLMAENTGVMSLGPMDDSHSTYEVIHMKYVEVFCRMLMSLSETRHGLTMLFVNQASLPLIDRVLSIKYRTRSRRINLLLQKIIAHRLRSDWMEPDEVSHKLDGQLSEALAVISAASAVDGALVISDQFEIVGFGAEILANDTAVETMHFSFGDSESKFAPRRLTDFGTRHRSAARFSRAMPDTITFVVSQDGDRKLMTCVDERVLVWNNLAWDRLWETISGSSVH